jgi:hypothetical protein
MPGFDLPNVSRKSFNSFGLLQDRRGTCDLTKILNNSLFSGERDRLAGRIRQARPPPGFAHEGAKPLPWATPLSVCAQFIPLNFDFGGGGWDEERGNNGDINPVRVRGIITLAVPLRWCPSERLDVQAKRCEHGEMKLRGHCAQSIDRPV